MNVIVTTLDTILNTSEAQRLALFYDRVIFFNAERTQLSKEERERANIELEYLRENKIALRCGMEMMPSGILSYRDENGNMRNFIDRFLPEFDLSVPFNLRPNVDKIDLSNEADADNMVRYISQILRIEEEPVTAHASARNLTQKGNTKNALELLVNDFPFPPENIPWQDLVEFKADEETKKRVMSFRLWMRKQATTTENPKHTLEELRCMLNDYNDYMRIQHKKYKLNAASFLLSSVPSAIANIASFNIGQALSKLVSVRSHNIRLTEAELNAPGREISYVSKISTIYDKRDT